MAEDTLKPHMIRKCNWGKAHECWADAYQLWIQMKFKGTIVSGFRKDFDLKSPHYWMELGNYVYTSGLIETTEGNMEWVIFSYKKDIYYKHNNIRINKVETEEESLLSIVNLRNRGYL